MAQEIAAPNPPAAGSKSSLATIARLEKQVAREQAARLAAEERAEHAHRALYERQEALRRYIAYVELLQDITVAANLAKTIDDAYAYALRQICIRDGWPISRAVSSRTPDWWTRSSRPCTRPGWTRPASSSRSPRRRS